MWDGLFGKRNFNNKCKTALRMIRMRMEPILKKRNAMQKFLKTDLADLLKNNLDNNAYGRAEGLYVELNLSSCYEYVQECCKIVGINVKAMHKERDCPQECRVAVASLMLATSRFADLHELRDLRALFAGKYGTELDHYASKEFVEKLKSNPPTTEMKIQLMKDVAKEFSVTWDPTSLEEKLRSPAPQQQEVNMSRTMSDDNLLAKKAVPRALEKVVSVPYVKPTIAKSVRSRFVDRNEEKEEVFMDKLLRHHSAKPWTEIPWPSNKDKGLELESESESEGSGSSSFQTNRARLHPKLPDCDDLANRVEALTKM